MKIRKILNNIASGILIILIVTILGFTVSAKLSNGNPTVFGHELLVVLSGSMEPGIKTGSVIAMKPTEDQKGYAEGDVITYRSVEDKNILITHRIVEVQEEANRVQYITKGDNNNAIDSLPIPAENVVGEYANFKIPYVGYALEFVNSSTGIILLLIVPGVLLMISSMVQVYKAIVGMEDKSKKINAEEEVSN